MSRKCRLMRRTAVASALLVVGGAVAPGAALAGIMAEATAASSVSTARWAAVPVGPGGSSLTTSFQTAYGSGGTRYALVDVYNSGSVAISGFTLTGTRGGGGNGTIQSCGSGWKPPSKSNQAPLCGSSTSGTAVGSMSPGRGLSVAAALPPGGRISLRIQSSSTTWSLSVAVSN